MTVGELIRTLQALPPDKTVYIASDEEWNNVRKAYAVDFGWLLEEDYEVRGIADEDVGTEYEESELVVGATIW